MKYREYMRIHSSDYEAIRSARAADADIAIKELCLSKAAKQLSNASDYYVCPDGSVYSRSIGRLIKLKPGVKPGGYEFVGVTTDDDKIKYFMIHRLVAEAFIPNPLKHPEINHLDGDKRNNFISNLEWCDRAHNQRHMFDLHGIKTGNSNHPFCRLKPHEVLEIRQRTDASYKEIGAAFGVCAQTVCNIKRRSTYADIA